METPSGSGAFAPWPDEAAYDTWSTNPAEDDDEFSSMNTSVTYGASELPPGVVMTTKIPPEFDGRGSWFAYEELVYDWCDACTLDEEARGPALKNRLKGEAGIYKTTLDRNRLKAKDGVDYFIAALRPEFIKGVHNIFLFRLL